MSLLGVIGVIIALVVLSPIILGFLLGLYMLVLGAVACVLIPVSFIVNIYRAIRDSHLN